MLDRAVGAVVGVMALGYVWYGFSVFQNDTYFYAAIPIEAAPPQVLYAVGKPDFARRPNQQWSRTADPNGHPEWLYASPFVQVRFNPATGVTTSVSCREDAISVRGPCAPALGVKVGFVEPDLVATLGPATSEQLLSGGSKVMNYPEVGYSFVLEKFRVKLIRKTPPEEGFFFRLARMFVWLIS